MPSIIAHPDSPWIASSVRLSVASIDVPSRRPTRPSTDHGTSTHVARVQRRVVGRVVALAGSLNILLGAVLADRHRAALGHRQRVVGMLQLNCEVDRRTADAFVDRWLSKRAMPQDT